MFECNIRVLGLPGAWFNSPAAIETCGPDARACEAACAEYEATGCEDTLREQLWALLIDPVDIDHQVRNPTKRPRRAYIALG